MTKRNRVFAGVVLAYLLGVGWLIWNLMADIDPRYRESAEDSLVESSQLIATLVEQQFRAGGELRAEPLAAIFDSLYARRFEAQIFSVRKTRVELRVVVVNAEGRVLFDSLRRAQGQDYSQWRDIERTLRGEYGARTSVDIDGDPNSSVMYVAAPLRIGERIVGAVSVGKPVVSFGQYVEQARRKTLLVGLTASFAVLLLMLIVWRLGGAAVRHRCGLLASPAQPAQAVAAAARTQHARRDRRRLRRDARRARRPQLRRRLRADA